MPIYASFSRSVSRIRHSHIFDIGDERVLEDVINCFIVPSRDAQFAHSINRIFASRGQGVGGLSHMHVKRHTHTLPELATVIAMQESDGFEIGMRSTHTPRSRYGEKDIKQTHERMRESKSTQARVCESLRE